MDEIRTCSHLFNSAAGKTQFGLQCSLFVQLPEELGGLVGSSCYLTTSSTLPTARLRQIAETNVVLSSYIRRAADGALGLMNNVHTISTPTIHTFREVLIRTLPNFLQSKRSDVKPVRLIIVDALAELFHESEKTTTQVLIERAQDITKISTLLQKLATTYNITILVLNEVVDSFQYPPPSMFPGSQPQPLIYNEQSRLFGRANSIPGEDLKEAALGLVWANQVNARILLTRTGRRRYIETPRANVGPIDYHEDEPPSKRQKIAGPAKNLPLIGGAQSDGQSTLIRRLAVVFSSVARPTSLDYIITEQGISSIQDDDYFTSSQIENVSVGLSTSIDVPGSTFSPTPAAALQHESTTVDILGTQPGSQFLQPLDVGIIEADLRVGREDHELDVGDMDGIVSEDEESDPEKLEVKKRYEIYAGGEKSKGKEMSEVIPPSQGEDEDWEAYWNDNKITDELIGTLRD